MCPGEQLQLATAAFERKLKEVKKSLGEQDFAWYPYDTFGYAKPVDALLLPNAVDLLKQLAANRPVLDMGCGDGALSFFLESLGCAVDAVDHPPTNHNGMRGIRRLRAALGSSVAIHSIDIEEQTDWPGALHGLTLMLGILYHLKNPFRILERLADQTQFCLLSTRVAQTTPRGARMSDEALAYLVAEYELNEDESNYWIFSEAGLRRILERTGWRIRGIVTTGHIAGSEPIRPDRDERATCLIESTRVPPCDAARLIAGWHEDEGGWRWTAREFSVEIPRHPLESPPNERKRLEFHFALHAEVAALGPVTLRASIGDRDLGSRTFRGAGEHVYTADLAADRASADAQPAGSEPLLLTSVAQTVKAGLRIDFRLDRAYHPPPPDRRELGLQVTLERTGPAQRREFANPIRLI